MTAILLSGMPRATDSNGVPLAGAKMYFYATGTTTLQTVYADSGLTTPLANPVLADAGGRYPTVYFDFSKTYRAYETTSAGSPTGIDIDPVALGVSDITNPLSMSGGATNEVDLTGTTATGTYLSGAGPVFSYYPSVGNDAGDHQRAQELIRFSPTQIASISEAGLAIDARISTGYAQLWAQSQTYTTGTLIDANGMIYKATAGGTSASSGSGPTGTGGSITDGTVTWAWQSHDQANAKMPMFITATASSGAGHVWCFASDIILNSGWNGNFACAAELDFTNNSGSDQPYAQTLFISGNAGANKIGAGISIFNPNATNYALIDAIKIGGAKTVTQSAVHDFAAGTYSYYDTGTHTTGINLAGTYSEDALTASGSVSVSYDFSRVNFFAASGSNNNAWRIISNVSGTSDGSIVVQHTTDRFASNFTTPATFNNDGSTLFGGAITLVPATSATPANNGQMTFELTSNTQLKVKVKGSDGTVRSVSLTLA